MRSDRNRKSHKPPRGPRPADAVPESGQRLARFPREGNEELRVSLDKYNGHPFIRLHKWGPGSRGGIVPLKGQGTTVRIAEIGGVIEALRQARALSEQRKAEADARGVAGDDGREEVGEAVGRSTTGRITPPWETPAVDQDDQDRHMDAQSKPVRYDPAVGECEGDS